MKAMVTAVIDRKENSQDDNINYLGPILKKRHTIFYTE